MNTTKIETIGYFDRVFVDGSLSAMGKSSGITIKGAESLLEALENNPEYYTHDIAKLRIEILGESIDNCEKDERERIKADRFENGIKLVSKCKNIERYLVAYADILLLKGDYAFPYRKNGIDCEEYYRKLEVTLDEYENYVVAKNIALEIAKLIKEQPSNINMVIVDKIYTYPIFRNCGIATWFHSNMAELINTYGCVYPHGLVLAYGDFTHQSLTSKNYIEFLRNHYIKQGYLELGTDKKIEWHIDRNCIMYKMLL